MCGDTACPSCGPAQVFNHEFELVCEWLDDLVDWPGHLLYGEDEPDPALLNEHLADVLGRVSDELREALIMEAKRWKRG